MFGEAWGLRNIETQGRGQLVAPFYRDSHVVPAASSVCSASHCFR